MLEAGFLPSKIINQVRAVLVSVAFSRVICVGGLHGQQNYVRALGNVSNNPFSIFSRAHCNLC
jgi:hypothetical protein